MIGAIVIQSVFQSIPLLIFIGKYGIKDYIANFLGFEKRFSFFYALYIGIIAGIMQEAFKYLGVELKPKRFAIWIGLGFSIIDIAALFIDASIARLITIFIFLNLISSLSFHPGTAMLLKYGRLIGKRFQYLALAITLHSLIDGGLVYIEMIGAFVKPKGILTYINLYWFIVIAISIGVLLSGYVLINKVDDKPIGYVPTQT